MDKVQFSEPLLFFNVIGMHPFKNDHFSKARKIFFVTVIFFTITTCLMELFINFEGLETFTRASEIMFPQYQLIWKVFVIIKHKNKLQWLIGNADFFWPLDYFGFDHADKLKINHRWLKKFYLSYKMFMGLSCLQYITAPLVLQTFTIRGMMICFNENEQLPLLARGGYFILHAAYMFCNLCVVCAFDGLFFYLVGHILSELALIKAAFGPLAIQPKWDSLRRFKNSAQHHSSVMKFIGLTSDTYAIPLLHQFISGFFALCFGLFLISKDGLPPASDTLAKFSSYIFVFVWQMWTFCFAGNLIINSVPFHFCSPPIVRMFQSLQIPENVFYECFNVEPEHRDVVGRMIAIQRGHRPAKLTIGGFMDLDLESFSQIINQSFSFFTFLNAMYVDQ